MRNVVVFLTVFVFLFSAAPAFAQRGSGSRFEDYFGRQSTGRGSANNETAGATIQREEVDEALEIASKEFLRVFVEKGFTVTPKEEAAVLVAEVETFSREREIGGGYYRYYRNPESIVYLTIRHLKNHAIIAVGRGKDSDIRRAAEKAANDAAKKIKMFYPQKGRWLIHLP